MQPHIVSRSFLAFVLEVLYFLGLLHFATTPVAAILPLDAVVAALIVGCLAIPFLVLPPRLTRTPTIATRCIAALLIVSGLLPSVAGHPALARDWSMAALGVALLVLPLRLRTPEPG